MTITYELNPPKVIHDTVLSHEQLQDSVNKLKAKAIEVSNVCNSIHVTDSVL
ncbi:MAG: 5,10-methenyltetrahydrofolate synthetase, partial [Thaumarchaeota archaeon]